MSSALRRPESRIGHRRGERTSICTEAEHKKAEPCRSGGASAGGRLTLGQVLDGVWEGLHAGGAAECPVCGGPMTSAAGTPAARCGDCGTTLS
jgi:hypothetical protein